MTNANATATQAVPSEKEIKAAVKATEKSLKEILKSKKCMGFDEACNYWHSFTKKGDSPVDFMSETFARIEERAKTYDIFDFLEMEDLNFHNLSCVFLAYRFGTRAQQQFMREMLLLHIVNGCSNDCNTKQNKKRYWAVYKLWTKLLMENFEKETFTAIRKKADEMYRKWQDENYPADDTDTSDSDSE